MRDKRLVPLLPILKVHKPNTFTSGETYTCPNCNSCIYPFYIKGKKKDIRYCESCGQAINWKSKDKAKIEQTI